MNRQKHNYFFFFFSQHQQPILKNWLLSGVVTPLKLVRRRSSNGYPARVHFETEAQFSLDSSTHNRPPAATSRPLNLVIWHESLPLTLCVPNQISQEEDLIHVCRRKTSSLRMR